MIQTSAPEPSPPDSPEPPARGVAARGLNGSGAEPEEAEQAGSLEHLPEAGQAKAGVGARVGGLGLKGLKRRRARWGDVLGSWPRPVQGVFWGLACALVAWCLTGTGRTHGLEGAALDILFQTRNWRGPRYPSPQVAIVVVDEAFVADYGFPIPRKYFADLVDYLKRDGARVIAFDIAFATKGNAQDDKKLALACARAGNVVHSGVFAMAASQVQGSTWRRQLGTEQPDTRFAWPNLDASNRLGLMNAVGAFSARPELQRRAVALGHVNVFPELDYGTLRRIPHLIRFRGRAYPSLALATAARALKLSPRDVRLRQNELILGTQPDAPRVPLQSRGEALVNWIGGYGTFPLFPLSRVLAPASGGAEEPFEPGTFKDKIVFVGAVNAAAFDHYPTPFGPTQPAVEMQANALDDILSRRSLRELPRTFQLVLLWGLPVLLGALIGRRNARAALWITLGFGLGAFVAALALFHANTYWPLASPLLAMGATALCCVSFRQVRDASHLKTARERYELAVDAANDGIWDWDLASGEIYYAARWKAMLGYSPGEVQPDLREWLDRVHLDDRASVEQALDEHLAGRSPQLAAEFRMRHRDGSWRWILARGLMVRGQDGAPTRMAGSLSDITDRQLAQEKLRRQAHRDELTGLPNRALFLERLRKAIARSRREPSFIFAVLFLDLDRFKIVNDSLGHLVGDEMLQVVAQRLTSSLRAGDTVARLGGDEFTLLMECIEGAHEPALLAERIQDTLKAPLRVGGHDFSTSASIGIAIALPPDASPAQPQVLEAPSAPENASLPDLSPVERALSREPRYTNAEELLRDADTAMYRAKSGGRARYVIFDDEMRARALDQLRLETALRRAIERDQLRLFFQPIVDLRPSSGAVGEASAGGLRGARVCGFEALVRWADPERGLILPQDFIPFAEETGLISALDQWVLRAACAQMQRWIESSGRRDLSISVNLSGRRFDQAGLVESVQGALSHSGLPARNLRLEVTETVVMEDARSSAQTLAQLKALGLSLAVDDFGTGYSSLSYLHQFPLDVLKIDRSFVTRIAPGGANGEIVQAVVQLARSLSLSVVAEGIEEDYHVALLRALGCDYGQGYYFSRPVDAQAAEKML